MSKIINYYNCKGGVGKTSLSYLTGIALHEKGFKTLLVDLDPQRSLTKSFLPKLEELTIFELLIETANIEDVIKKTELGPDIIPGSLKLLNIQNNIEQNKMQNLLKKLKYDFIIIDNSPTYNSLIISSLQTSDILIIPSLISIYDLDEVLFVIQKMKSIRKESKINVLLNRVQYTDKVSKDEQDYMDVFKEKLGNYLTKTRLANTSLIRKTIDRKENLSGKNKQKEKLAKSLNEFIKEVIL
jgi:cellulose biosynthesis protein BcsQ